MKAAKVIGRVVASRKYETLEGKRLLLLQPMTWEKEPNGDPIVAVDACGAGADEFVFYVAAREAAVALGQEPEDRRRPGAVEALGQEPEDRTRPGAVRVVPDLPPVDAAVVGIIDGVNLQGWTMPEGTPLKSAKSGHRSAKREEDK